MQFGQREVGGLKHRTSFMDILQGNLLIYSSLLKAALNVKAQKTSGFSKWLGRKTLFKMKNGCKLFFAKTQMALTGHPQNMPEFVPITLLMESHQLSQITLIMYQGCLLGFNFTFNRLKKVQILYMSYVQSTASNFV